VPRQLCERALAIQEKVLGPEHPDTNSTRRNLAKLLLAFREAGKALEFGQAALAAYDKSLGSDHPWMKNSARLIADALDELEFSDPPRIRWNQISHQEVSSALPSIFWRMLVIQACLHRALSNPNGLDEDGWEKNTFRASVYCRQILRSSERSFVVSRRCTVRSNAPRLGERGMWIVEALPNPVSAVSRVRCLSAPRRGFRRSLLPTPHVGSG